ncbi:unnamed protein product [Rotaria magnacalcarata]|uniref:Galactosylgalactosylxylosylprotein 3-beta-glucuronosyltransferase n=2 Tax=Rotaria magnacalcarata TaxID=392030 RepID=A0A819MM54_9BILA|nr:unnamed protein product [Rotaria magnacalcarata]CAF3913576.1 unnamed protein product [Rotaria magnacalcarata]CAF3982032.1 unnamed protein product [Rotaria magnacalcarata]CAF4048733.1 unnamed protein product [Rotaria magnacalcarata]
MTTDLGESWTMDSREMKNIDNKQDVKPWEQLLSMYPGLVVPIQESWKDPLSIRKIYMITPTKTRAEQIADLTRLAQTLYLIPNLFWIIVEDESQRTGRLHRLLQSFNLPFIHLNIATPDYLKPTKNQSTWRRPRGMHQKNIALQWVRENTSTNEDALVYFADDDNTYHWKLFQEIRKIQLVGVWPVGLVGELLYERPICLNGKVYSWFHYIYRKRKFPTDMAGFAIHLGLVHKHSNYLFNVSANSVGEQESNILGTMTSMNQLECLANNASKIYVWHTKTQSMFLTTTEKLRNAGMKYDLISEL